MAVSAEKNARPSDSVRCSRSQSQRLALCQKGWIPACPASSKASLQGADAHSGKEMPSPVRQSSIAAKAMMELSAAEVETKPGILPAGLCQLDTFSVPVLFLQPAAADVEVRPMYRHT